MSRTPQSETGTVARVVVRASLIVTGVEPPSGGALRLWKKTADNSLPCRPGSFRALGLLLIRLEVLMGFERGTRQPPVSEEAAGER